MIRIGLVNIDTSHPKAFADYLSKGDRARYAAVYNDGFRRDDEVEGFIKRFGLEKRCRSLDELADIVDIGFVQSCNWDNHLREATPFIERGKPVFIDKPIVGSASDCRKLEELASSGAVILGSSSVRYGREAVEFVSIPEEERGRIVSVFGTAGVDEFNYGIHIVEAVHGIAGFGAESCRFIGRAEIQGKGCETFYVRFKNGITGVYNTFHGTWQPFEVVVMTTKATHRFRIETGAVYAALLDRICDYMETGKSELATVPQLTEAVRIALAGRISRENGGAEVKISDIPIDDPGYSGSEFEKDYAAKAGKLYL